MPLQSPERRKYHRHLFNSSVEFKIIRDFSDDLFIGYTINVSAMGLCVGLYRPLKQGQQISIQRVFLPFLLGKATVQWVRELDGELYVAGLRIE